MQKNKGAEIHQPAEPDVGIMGFGEGLKRLRGMILPLEGETTFSRELIIGPNARNVFGRPHQEMKIERFVYRNIGGHKIDCFLCQDGGFIIYTAHSGGVDVEGLEMFFMGDRKAMEKVKEGLKSARMESFEEVEGLVFKREKGRITALDGLRAIELEGGTAVTNASSVYILPKTGPGENVQKNLRTLMPSGDIELVVLKKPMEYDVKDLGQRENMALLLSMIK
ncbi:MAG: hypothetical protein KKD39_04635 [Candidatus Altiarchaeota archaeon]|nr:hypothetical protein [Candidatus Altiarchaeota archaeon]